MVVAIGVDDVLGAIVAVVALDVVEGVVETVVIEEAVAVVVVFASNTICRVQKLILMFYQLINFTSNH